MAESFITVSQQTIILFILILVGLICTRAKMLSDKTIKELSKFVLTFVTPCLIIESFNRPYDSDMLKKMLIATVAAICVHFLNIVASRVLLKDKEKSRECVYQYAAIFGNCGYMGIPLQQAILGSEGVFYGALFVAVFNVITWTYGIVLMGNKNEKIQLKKITLNPGILGVVIGFIIFITSTNLPNVIKVPIHSLAALNTPLPMVIIGYYLAQITTLKVLKDKKLLLTASYKLVICPVITLVLLYTLGFKGVLLASVVVSASTPTAANTVMFSVLYNRDTKLGVTLMTSSTLLSLITMPLIISIALALA